MQDKAPKSTTGRPVKTASPPLRSSKKSPKEGSRKNSLTETSKNAKDDATNDIEEVNDDDIMELSKHNRDNTQLRTTELELAKNATTILRAATKRKMLLYLQLGTQAGLIREQGRRPDLPDSRTKGDQL